jgi:hypothetical protein
MMANEAVSALGIPPSKRRPAVRNVCLADFTCYKRATFPYLAAQAREPLQTAKVYVTGGSQRLQDEP